MAERLVYHWKHGWLPLTHAAALQKAHGNHKAAEKMVPSSGAAHVGSPMISRGDLRRSPHIAAARAPGGKIALRDSKTGKEIKIDEGHAASLHSQEFTITGVHDGTFSARSSYGTERRYGADGSALHDPAADEHAARAYNRGVKRGTISTPERAAVEKSHPIGSRVRETYEDGDTGTVTGHTQHGMVIWRSDTVRGPDGKITHNGSGGNISKPHRLTVMPHRASVETMKMSDLMAEVNSPDPTRRSQVAAEIQRRKEARRSGSPRRGLNNYGTRYGNPTRLQK